MGRSVCARCVVGISAVLMLGSGLGVILAIAIGMTIMFGNALLVFHMPYWAHGLSLIIPSLVGIFVGCSCGCCNKKPAYIVSAVFDCLGAMSFLGPLAQLWALDAALLAYGKHTCYEDFMGNCNCAEDPSVSANNIMSGFTFSLQNDCQRYPALYHSGMLLAAMWVVGALSLTVHLVLVIYLACTFKEEGSRGQVLGARASQTAMVMTSTQPGYYQGGLAPPAYSQQQGYLQPGQPGYGGQQGQPAYMQHVQHGQQYYSDPGQPGYYQQQGYPTAGYPSLEPPQGGLQDPQQDYPVKGPM